MGRGRRKESRTREGGEVLGGGGVCHGLKSGDSYVTTKLV